MMNPVVDSYTITMKMKLGQARSECAFTHFMVEVPLWHSC